MLAVLNAISLVDGELLEIYSDSGYVVKGYNDPSYLDKWIANGWKTSTKKPVLNQDLWEQFVSIPWEKKFHLNLIKGHNKDRNPIHAFWNDICDQVCTYTMEHIVDDKIHCVAYNLKTKEIQYRSKEVIING